MIYLVAIPVGLLFGIAIELSRTKAIVLPGSASASGGSGSGSGDLPSLATVLPKAPSAEKAKRIVKLADTMSQVWTDVTGRSGPMPSQVKLIALAQAAAEGTGYGQGWEMVGNVGSYQCGGKQQGTSYYDCVPHKDSRPDPKGGPNIVYTTTFRSYKAGPGPDGKSRDAFANGVFDYLKSITMKPFVALDELLSGNLLDYCLRQYKNHYFEGFNLSKEGLTAYAQSVAYLIKMGAPVRRAGETAEVVAGRICFYAASMARNLPEIAGALGMTEVPVKVPVDLVQPWKGSFQAKAGASVSGFDGNYFRDGKAEWDDEWLVQADSMNGIFDGVDDSWDYYAFFPDPVGKRRLFPVPNNGVALRAADVSTKESLSSLVVAGGPAKLWRQQGSTTDIVVLIP